MNGGDQEKKRNGEYDRPKTLTLTAMAYGVAVFAPTSEDETNKADKAGVVILGISWGIGPSAHLTSLY